jgi:hypothetical protein
LIANRANATSGASFLSWGPTISEAEPIGLRSIAKY